MLLVHLQSAIEAAAGPTWTDVVTAVASLAALAIASIAAVAAFKTNGQQSKQLERLEEESRDQEQYRVRQQADRVAVWMASNLGIYLVNDNNQPIYDVTVRYRRGNRSWMWERSVVKPAWDDEYPLQPITTEIQNVSRGEYVLGLGLPLDYDREKYEEVGYDIRHAWEEWAKEGVSIEFRDVSGHKWARDRYGMLARLDR